MSSVTPSISCLLTLILYLGHSLRNALRSHRSLALEHLALRSQLALFEGQELEGKRPKPKPTPAFRLLWRCQSSA
jgi:putative transposase